MDAERNLFDRFGGVRPMAEVLCEPPSTVQSWKTSGRIPATKQPLVLHRAEQLNIDVQAIDVIFPLRVRTDIYPPVVTSGPLPTDGDAVEAGVPTDQFDRDAGMKRAAGA